MMGKKANQKARRAIEVPIEGELEAEAAYYARKVGITRDEALSIIKEAHVPKLSIVGKSGAKGR